LFPEVGRKDIGVAVPVLLAVIHSEGGCYLYLSCSHSLETFFLGEVRTLVLKQSCLSPFLALLMSGPHDSLGSSSGHFCLSRSRSSIGLPRDPVVHSLFFCVIGSALQIGAPYFSTLSLPPRAQSPARDQGTELSTPHPGHCAWVPVVMPSN
jgi:hypothetical protein